MLQIVAPLLTKNKNYKQLGLVINNFTSRINEKISTPMPTNNSEKIVKKYEEKFENSSIFSAVKGIMNFHQTHQMRCQTFLMAGLTVIVFLIIVH